MPLEPETDITASAIMWLLDDPTFSPDHRATVSEVLKALGADDPDDPLAIALVQEGVTAARKGPTEPVSVAGWKPELCGEDRNRVGCAEPIGGTGRCMACGSQRREPEKPDPAIKAAQMSDKEPEEIRFLEIEGGQGESGEAAPCGHYETRDGVCVTCGIDLASLLTGAERASIVAASEPVLPLDAAPAAVPPGFSPRPDAAIRRKNAKPLRPTPIKITNFNKIIPPPDADTVQRRLDQMIEGVRGDLPLTLRLKRITGLSDEEIGVFINRSRATIQAYAQDNRTELLDAAQIKVLRTVLELKRDMLSDLLIELEAKADVL